MEINQIQAYEPNKEKSGDNLENNNSTTMNDTITWSQISEPAYVSDDEEKKRDAEPKGCCTKGRIKCYIILGVIFFLLLVIIILWNLVSKQFFNWLLETVENLAQSDSIWALFFFIGAQFAFSWFVIPGLSYFDIIMSFFMKNFLKAWLIATFGSWSAGVILFILIRCCFKKKLEMKFKNNAFYKVLKSEVKSNPWKTSTLINILFIPTAFKNYTIPLTDLNLIQYMLPSLPFYMFFSAMLTLIGHQISSLEDLQESGFSKMNFAQKLNFFVSWFLLVSTFLIVVCFGKIAKRKMNELTKREKRMRSKRKKGRRRLEKYEKEMMERKYENEKICKKLEWVRKEVSRKEKVEGRFKA